MYDHLEERDEQPENADVNIEPSFFVYPNPAKETVFIQFFESRDWNNESFSLIDSHGQNVAVDYKEAGHNLIKLSTGQLDPGLYLVGLHSKQEYQKLIIF